MDIIETLLTYRGKNKLTQFLISWEDYLDEHDRMHPRYLVNGTITGRLSCKDPNLQQVPRDPLARSCITAPEGFILGVGAKIFTIAGPVILYGTLSSVLYGIVFWIISLCGGGVVC